jgi:hypothetical protein
VNHVFLNGYNFQLDTGLLHPLVFKQLTVLQCVGTLKSIQTDLFTNFANVSVKFTFSNLGNFYHQIGIEWINYVSAGSNLTMISNNVNVNYTYPDRDFCIFAQFPLEKRIQLSLDYTGSNCTITYAWLCTHGRMSLSPCYNKTVNKDKLDSMIKLCHLQINETGGSQQRGSSAFPSYPDVYQARLIRMLIMELVPFVFLPSACLISLFFNWKIIQTIHKNKNKELKEDFYKYMSANAKFNCLYCLIFVFYPMTSCNWALSSSFCSSVFTTKFVQYFKIVMIGYFGEVVKMCANISYLMMTLNRYLLVGKEHSPWLVTIAKLEFKWVIWGSLLFSALINVGHGWEYVYAGNMSVLISPNIVYVVLNGYSYSDYPLANQEMPYFIYSIVYFVINFGVFFILNTGIEIKIVRRMQKELKEKRKRMAKMNASHPSSSALTTIDLEAEKKSRDDDKKREEEDGIKERKVIKMVVLNGLFNFVLRAPDMLSWANNSYLMGYLESVNSLLMANVNGTPGFLNLITDIGYLSYILTFTTNFLIFYLFNKKFKEFVVFF